MYERFTDRARKVMQCASSEAKRFNYEYLGTEHILLGLLKEGSGTAANVLTNLDLSLRKVRSEVEKMVHVGSDSGFISARLQPSSRAKKAMEYAVEESFNLGHHYVGTEHLLLGLLRVEDGVAAQALMNLGLVPNTIPETVLQLLAGTTGQVEIQDCSANKVEQLPSDVRKVVQAFDQLIERLLETKENAVEAAHQSDNQKDWEKAASIRDHESSVKKLRVSFIQLWPK